MAVQIQLRRGTAAQWTSANTLLAQGELGLETDTNKFKFGDGVTTWNSLAYFSGGGTGTVTSVALSLPSFLNVSGSPITTSGTLAVTLANETANLVFAGPSSGSPAAPTFRSLVTADLPAGVGSVTSVSATVPLFFSVSGSPITSSGTLAISANSQSANLVLAGPTSGGATVPTFRSLVSSDIPATTLTSDVTGSGSGSFATTVVSVGGSSASNVHSAELAANAATNLNTASTIVKRDSSGNFSAGTITASLTGHSSLDLALAGGTLVGTLNLSTLTASTPLQLDSSKNVISSAIDLATAQVTGNLAVTHLNSGTSASSSTFWRGDGTWSTAGSPPGGSNQQIQFNDSGVFGGASAVLYDKSTGDFGAGINNTGIVTLTHDFQVGGGNSYFSPTSISGALTYYTPPSAPTLPVATATYAQLIPDSTSITALQVDAGGNYVADGTVALSFYVAPYFTVDGLKLYGPGATTVVFSDNNDSSNFYIQLDWAPVAGVQGYEIWRNGTYNGISVSFQSIDVGNAVTHNDDGATGWNTLVPYPPSPNHLAYSATGTTSSFHIFDYLVQAGANLYSLSSLNTTFTDDNRSQHPPATFNLVVGSGTYASNLNITHSYQVWSRYSDGGFSSTDITASQTVSDTTVGTPSTFFTTPNYGSGSYTANNSTYTYYVKAYKSTPAGYVFSGTLSSSFTDDNSGNPFSVDITLTAPAGGADGYILYLNGGEFGLVFNSINIGNVLSYNDNAGSWSTAFPFNLGGLSAPTSLGAVQNDLETGYTADGTNIFTYNLASYWVTPLGRSYSAPSSCQVGFTDNSDLSTFGVDLSWGAAGTDPNGNNPDGYELWVVGGVHPLNTAQDVGNVLSFADQNNSWSTLNYQPSGSASYTFSYGIQLSWGSVPTIVNYYVVKTSGDSGPSYPIFDSTASTSLNDTDDSVWTAGATTPPTPTEQNTFYDIHLSWTAAAGSPTYRILRDLNSSGFIYSHDTASTSIIDGNSSFTYTSPANSVTNTLYHATGQTIPIKAYSYNNTDAVYSPTFSSNSVTDDNSGRYYSIDWTASNYATSVDKLKFIINTTNGELLTNPTLSYVDTNGSVAYNSDTVVTPNSVSTKFFSDRLGNVTIDTLTCLTTIITPKIGNGVGLLQLGSSANAAASGGISLGNGSVCHNADSIAIGTNALAGGFSQNDNVVIGHNAASPGSEGIAIGLNTSCLGGSSNIAIGMNSNTGLGNGNCIVIGFGASTASTVTSAIAMGNGAASNATSAIAFGQANASGAYSLSFGYLSSCSADSGIAIGKSANSSGSPNGIAIGTNSATASNYDLAIGYASSAAGGTSIALGFGAFTSAAGADSTVVGPSASSSSTFSTAIGYSNVIHTSSDSSSAVGSNNSVSSRNCSILGKDNSIGTSSSGSQIFGNSSTITSSSGSTSIGSNSISSSNNSLAFGTGNTISGVSGGFGTMSLGFSNTIAGINEFAFGQGLSPAPGFMNFGYGSSNPIIYLDSNTNHCGVNQASPAFTWDVNGTVNAKIHRFQGSSSGSVTVQPAAVAGSWTMTLPIKATPTNGLLQTDGTGITIWADPIVNNDEVICFSDSIVYLT